MLCLWVLTRMCEVRVFLEGMACAPLAPVCSNYLLFFLEAY